MLVVVAVVMVLSNDIIMTIIEVEIEESKLESKSVGVGEREEKRQVRLARNQSINQSINRIDQWLLSS